LSPSGHFSSALSHGRPDRARVPARPAAAPATLHRRPRARTRTAEPSPSRLTPPSALKILTLLQGLGADLRYHDPYVPELREHGLSSVSLDDALEDADLALIVTAHPQVDHELVAQRARLLVDLRGVTRTLGVADAVRL
jgi:hypothetical protein